MSTRKKLLIIVTICLISFFSFMLWSIIPVTETPPVFSSTRILAADGTLLYEVSAYDGRTTQPVTLDKFPPLFVSAVLAAEDSRFYRHHGIDWRALIRATRDNLLRRRVVGGASTIEQQLVKNFYFRDRRRSFIQKARELIAARWWSLTQTKDETLEIYLNTVYLGNNVFGAPAAAREYFHKDVGDLSLSEATLLAGMIGAPSRYDPLTHLSAAKARQKYVFERMKTMGIDVADAEGAAANVALSIFPPQDNIRAPHFVFRVLDELQEKIPDVWSGGYTITTTLDSDLEMQAAASVERRLYKLAESNVTDAALIAVEPQTGNVLAYIGGLNWRDGESGKINMAKVARQPGSALKPFLYELALMKNFTPATVIADLPVRFETERGSYYPRNYNFKYYGPVTVREALGSSLNIPAVKILNEIGISGFANTLARFGISFPEPPEHYGLSMVLGGGEVTLEAVTGAYAALANGNKIVPLNFVSEVKDSGGKIIWKYEAPTPIQIFDFAERERGRQAGYLVTDILSDRTARGKAFGETSLMDIGKRVPAKTGTTADFRDNWAFGFTPEFVVGVWTGNADNSPMHGVSGVAGAVPIWHDVMSYYYRHNDPPPIPIPIGIITKDICSTSGLLTTPVCPKTRTEKFISGTEPVSDDNWYQELTIDTKTKLLAESSCAAKTLKKIYLIPPPEYYGWLLAAGFEQPPFQDCEGHRAAYLKDAVTAPVIIAPLDGDTIQIDPNIDAALQKIPFIAGGIGGKNYVWTLNRQQFTVSQPIFLWSPRPGSYTLTLEGASGQVAFIVK